MSIIKSHSEYLDPANAGSIVGYRLYAKDEGSYIDSGFEIDITDCNRLVTWSAGDAEQLEEKLRTAIGVFERAIVQARAVEKVRVKLEAELQARKKK